MLKLLHALSFQWQERLSAHMSMFWVAYNYFESSSKKKFLLISIVESLPSFVFRMGFLEPWVL